MLIYVLQLEQNKYYVGRTNDLQRRFQEHLQGQGSAWTSKFRPIKILESSEGDRFDEDKITKQLMAKHGLDSVRGGTYANIELSSDQRRLIQAEIDMALDKCLTCGKSGHFAKECKEFTSGADPQSYNLFYLLGNYFGLTSVRTYWCSICNKEFFKDVDRFDHEALCKIYYSDRCTRCARRGHTKAQCYAKTHSNGSRF